MQDLVKIQIHLQFAIEGVTTVKDHEITGSIGTGSGGFHVDHETSCHRLPKKSSNHMTTKIYGL